MTRTEEVDAAIERAKTDVITGAPGGPLVEAWRDRRLLAEEVVLLREAVRGLQEELAEVKNELWHERG